MGTAFADQHPSLVMPPAPRLAPVDLPQVTMQVHPALEKICLPLVNLMCHDSFAIDDRPATVPECRKLTLHPGEFVQTFTLQPPAGESHLKIRDVIFTLKFILQHP